MTMKDETYFIDLLYQVTKHPQVKHFVWEVKYSIFNPVRCLSSPAPGVVIELTKY